MDKRLTRLILAVAALSAGAAYAQQKTVTPAPAQDAVKTTMEQYTQDMKTAQTDRAAAQQICQTPGPDCDAAKSKVAADEAKTRTDKEAYTLAMRGPQTKPVNTHRVAAVVTMPGPASVSAAPAGEATAPHSWFSRVFHGTPKPAAGKASPATTAPSAAPAAH